MENSSKIGEEMHELIKDLFPICRSITGNGTRKTLKIISQAIQSMKDSKRSFIVITHYHRILEHLDADGKKFKD